MDDDKDFGFGSFCFEEKDGVPSDDGKEDDQSNQPVGTVVASPTVARGRMMETIAGAGVEGNDTTNANGGSNLLEVDSEEGDSEEGDSEDEESLDDNDDEEPSPATTAIMTTTMTTTSSTLSKRRRRFLVRQKMKYVMAINKKMREENILQRAAVAFFNIDYKQTITWKKQLPEFAACRRNKKAKSLCKGCPPILRSIENDLLQFIFERREQGMAVTINMIVLKASQINPEFRHKTKDGKYHSVRRFVRHHSFIHRMSTHESQHAPAETAAEATDWLETVARPKVS